MKAIVFGHGPSPLCRFGEAIRKFHFHALEIEIILMGAPDKKDFQEDDEDDESRGENGSAVVLYQPGRLDDPAALDATRRQDLVRARSTVLEQ